MAQGRLSVAEAAAMLGVHPQRIHQRIRDRSLPAEKIGNQWALEVDDVRRVRHHGGPGRPLSPRSAWDLLAVAADGEVAAQLSPSARSRARSRLRKLLQEAASSELPAAAALISNSLGNRASRILYVASSRDLPDLRRDHRVHLSGISLPQSNMSVGEIAEGYVDAEDLNALVDDYLLSPAPSSRANVNLHVVHPISGSRPALDEIARSPLALAADLAEYDGVRERAAALRALGDLSSELVNDGARIGVDDD